MVVVSLEDEATHKVIQHLHKVIQPKFIKVVSAIDVQDTMTAKLDVQQVVKSACIATILDTLPLPVVRGQRRVMK